jgi:hypothetical protein
VGSLLGRALCEEDPTLALPETGEGKDRAGTA